MQLAAIRVRFIWCLITILTACSRQGPVTDAPPREVGGSFGPAPQSARTADAGQNTSDSAAVQLTAISDRIWAVHDPLYAASGEGTAATHPASFTARAMVATSLVSIDIDVTKGTAADCEADGSTEPVSVVPCMGDATIFTVSCPFADEPAGQCSFPNPIDVSEQELVSYRATATDSEGNTISTEPIRFAYGMPSDKTAKPLWWHRGTGADTGAKRISVAFFPDQDYTGQGFAEYAMQVNQIVTKVFFSNQDGYAKEYTAHRDYFDLWVAPFGASVDSQCIFYFDSNVAPARTLAKGAAIIHSDSWKPLGDCAEIHNPGNGSVWGSSDQNGWIMAHEGGHFLFGLGDEYGAGGHTSCSTPANVFPSKEVCEATRSSLPTPIGSCVQVAQTDNVWRIDDDEQSYELMDDEAGDWSKSTFRRSAHDAVLNRLAQCDSGPCFSQENPSCIGN